MATQAISEEAKPGLEIYGIFQESEQVERAHQFLKDHDYEEHGFGVIMSEAARGRFATQSRDTDASSETAGESRALEGAAIMSTAGAIFGGLLAASIVIAAPGVGLLVAGPILAGVGMGAGAGGLFGGLIGASIPKHEADFYEERIKNGAIVARVIPETQQEVEDIETEWKRIGGEIRRYPHPPVNQSK